MKRQRFSKSLSALVVCGTALGTLAWATDDFALVSGYYGAVGYLSLDGTGAAGPITDVTSPTQIQYGSYGIGIGDFDNDGLDDYLTGGTNATYYGPVSIEFHRRTGSGPNDFAAGRPVDGGGGWYYYVMDFAVADYDHDGNLDFAVNNYNDRRVETYRGHGDGTFTRTASYQLDMWAFGMDAGDINNDGNADIVVARNWDEGGSQSCYFDYYYYYNYCSFSSASKRVAILLGDGHGNFSLSTQKLTFSVSFDLSQYVNQYYYVYVYDQDPSYGVALADFDGDGQTDMVLDVFSPAMTGDRMLLVFRGLGDGTFDETPIASAPFDYNDSYYNYYSYASLDNDDVNHDGIQDVVFASENRLSVRTYLGNGDGTFHLGTESSPSFWLTGVSTRPGDTASDRRAPLVKLDATIALTNQTAIAITGSATDSGGVASIEIYRNGELVDTLTPSSGSTFSSTISLAEGTNEIFAKATDRAGNAAESNRALTILDTQRPQLELGGVPAFATEETFALHAITNDANGIGKVQVTLNGKTVPSKRIGDAISATLTLRLGTNQIEVASTDLAGNSSRVGASIILDTAGPDLDLAALPEFTNQRTRTISGSTTDDNGVTSLVLTVNGAYTAPVTPDGDGAFSVDVSLAEGENTIAVVATDAAGLSTTKSVRTFLDTLPPLAKLAPLAEYTRLAELQAHGTAIDNESGVASAKLSVVGSDANAVTPDGDGSVDATLTLSEGRRTIVLEVVDRAGNIGATSAEITLDTIAPQVAVVSPISGQPFGQTTVPVVGHVVDATPTTVSFGGLQFHVREGGDVVSGAVEVSGEGPNVVVLVARDAAGNEAQAHVQFVVDLSAPVADLDFVGFADGAAIGPQPGNAVPYTLHVDDLTEVTGTFSWGGGITAPAGGTVHQGLAPRRRPQQLHDRAHRRARAHGNARARSDV